MHHYSYLSTGQFKNTISEIKKIFRLNQQFDNLPSLKFLGTVKLHGTNSSVYSDLSNPESFVVQSKNNIITPELDNFGFASYITPIKDLFTTTFSNIKNISPEYKDKTAVIYGEWCGENIQPSIALSNLPKMFVIFSIKVVNKNSTSVDDEIWLSKSQIEDVLSTNKEQLIHNNIYSSFDFPHWIIDIDFNYPQLSQNKLVDITMDVEKECPVGKQLGSSGVGEGVVWQCISEHPFLTNKNFIFKVKGKEHSVSHVSSLAMVDTEKINSVKEFVEKVVTENRLKQGVEYLNEQHLPISINHTKDFINWILKDCLKEEKDMIVEGNLNEKQVTQAICIRAKDWFLSNIPKVSKPKF
jgi:hypothetical protein